MTNFLHTPVLLFDPACINILFFAGLSQCSFPWGPVSVCVCSIAQACSTLCKSPMDWSLPCSSAHGVLNYKWSQWLKPWLTSVQSLQVFVEMTLCIVWLTEDFQSHSNLDHCSSVSRGWPWGSLDLHFGCMESHHDHRKVTFRKITSLIFLKLFNVCWPYKHNLMRWCLADLIMSYQYVCIS